MLESFWTMDIKSAMVNFQIVSTDSVGAALVQFFNTINHDKVIAHTHICLYLAILHLLVKTGTHPIHVSRSKIMHLAKIKSKTTYHKCINELVTRGYITYQPSYHPEGETKISLYLQTKEASY